MCIARPLFIVSLFIYAFLPLLTPFLAQLAQTQQLNPLGRYETNIIPG